MHTTRRTSRTTSCGRTVLSRTLRTRGWTSRTPRSSFTTRESPSSADRLSRNPQTCQKSRQSKGTANSGTAVATPSRSVTEPKGKPRLAVRNATRVEHSTPSAVPVRKPQTGTTGVARFVTELSGMGILPSSLSFVSSTFPWLRRLDEFCRVQPGAQHLFRAGAVLLLTVYGTVSTRRETSKQRRANAETTMERTIRKSVQAARRRLLSVNHRGRREHAVLAAQSGQFSIKPRRRARQLSD